MCCKICGNFTGFEKGLLSKWERLCLRVTLEALKWRIHKVLTLIIVSLGAIIFYYTIILPFNSFSDGLEFLFEVKKRRKKMDTFRENVYATHGLDNSTQGTAKDYYFYALICRNLQK